MSLCLGQVNTHIIHIKTGGSHVHIQWSAIVSRVWVTIQNNLHFENINDVRRLIISLLFRVEMDINEEDETEEKTADNLKLVKIM